MGEYLLFMITILIITIADLFIWCKLIFGPLRNFIDNVNSYFLAAIIMICVIFIYIITVIIATGLLSFIIGIFT